MKTLIRKKIKLELTNLPLPFFSATYSSILVRNFNEFADTHHKKPKIDPQST